MAGCINQIAPLELENDPGLVLHFTQKVPPLLNGTPRPQLCSQVLQTERMWREREREKRQRRAGGGFLLWNCAKVRPKKKEKFPFRSPLKDGKEIGKKVDCSICLRRKGRSGKGNGIRHFPLKGTDRTLQSNKCAKLPCQLCCLLRGSVQVKG